MKKLLVILALLGASLASAQVKPDPAALTDTEKLEFQNAEKDVTIANQEVAILQAKIQATFRADIEKVQVDQKKALDAREAIEKSLAKAHDLDPMKNRIDPVSLSWVSTEPGPESRPQPKPIPRPAKK